MVKLIQRQKDILELLKIQKYARIKELAQQFSVSQETVRRDLEQLEAADYVVRNHGGATYKASVMENRLFEERSVQNLTEKEAIAGAAAALIVDGDAVAVIGSTTAFQLCPYLRARNHLILLTNDLAMGTAVSENKTNQVIFMGGAYVPYEYCTWGDETTQALEQFHPDKAFFSSTGVSWKDGITSYIPHERNLLKKAVEMSRESFLLADHTKFDRVGLYSTCPLRDITGIVTDWRTPSRVLEELKEHEVRMIVGRSAEKARAE